MYPAKQRNIYQDKLHQHIVIYIGARTPIHAKEKIPIQSGPKISPVYTKRKIPIQSTPKTTPVDAKHQNPDTVCTKSTRHTSHPRQNNTKMHTDYHNAYNIGIRAANVDVNTLQRRTVIYINARTLIDTKERIPIQPGPKISPVDAK